ncbi:MAG: DUF1329 domain-containing protein [Deltaproteobacteria bacterium]|nr:DUF1329 domain-containing protein [Deltaproteobacteria bacterium]
MKRFQLLLGVCIVLAGASGAASAEEVAFPVASYEGAALQKVRAWEKTWAGKKVTTADVDQVKDFLHEAVYKAMKEPNIFGAESIWFEIKPYRTYAVSPGMLAATRKYAPASRLDEKQNLVGYGEVAGIPFPQPKTGVEMAWNFDSNTKGDTHHLFHTGTVVDCRTRHEREAGHLRWELRWVGRYDVPPVPKIAKKDNRRGIAHSFFQRHTAPADFVDTTMLEIKYLDLNRDTDLWVYTAMFRRVRRYATSQRTDMIDGTDMIYDDQDGWYTHPGHNIYTYKGRADLLVARHQDVKPLQRRKGQGFWSGVQRERVNHWVVEAVNKDKNYIYGKQIWYLDPETWQMNFKVMYNRQGELWKMYELFYDEFPSYGGHTTAIFNGEHVVDFIRRHGSPGAREIKSIGGGVAPDLFQVKSLKQRSY